MASRSWRLLCAAVCLTAAPATLRAEEPAPPKRFALVLYSKGTPDRGLMERFLAVLADVDDRAGSISIVGGRDPFSRVGRAHAKAVVACGANLRCVAAVGEKAGADHILFGRATAKPDGVGMQWLVVNVRTASIVGKLSTSLTSPIDAAAAADQVARELLGVTDAELTAQTDAALAATAVSAATASTGTTETQPQAAKPAADPATGPAAPAPQSPCAPGPSFWSPARAFGGGAVALGALTIGVAVYFSQRPSVGAGDVAWAPRALGAALPAGTRILGDGRRSALIAAGGVLVAGGAALLGHDSPRVTPVVSVEPDAKTAGVSVSW